MGIDQSKSERKDENDSVEFPKFEGQPGDLLRHDQKGSLNFAANPRPFDDGSNSQALADSISSGNARISSITGYTYGNGLYFSGIQIIYEVDGQLIPGPEYVTDKSWPKTLTLESGEKIVEMGLQHGEIVDQLWVLTSKGRREDWGGLGGIEQIWQIPDGYELIGFSGNQGPWRAGRSVMNTCGPVFVCMGKIVKNPIEEIKSNLISWVSLENSQLPQAAVQTHTQNHSSRSIEDSNDRSVLELFYTSCGMPHHGEGDSRKELLNWGSNAPIGLWEGVVVNTDGKVTELYLERCGLKGELPVALGDLDCLEELWMPMNKFEGPLPESLINCHKLRTVNLHGNSGLSGLIPPQLLEMPGLIFYVHNTELVSDVVSLEVPAFNFHVILREGLLQLTRLIPHEEALKVRGLLTYLGPERTFTKWFGGSEEGGVKREQIAFMSHRWLDPHGTHPDCEKDSKLKHVQSLLIQNPHIKYIWMDYLCVPQAPENRSKNVAAINSLPNYIKSCGNVFILVGDSGEAQYSVFNTRGWCQLETACACIKVCGQNPAAHMYAPLDFPVETLIFLANKDDGSVTLIDGDQLLMSGNLDPMEGAFTVEADKRRIAPSLKLMANHILTDCDDKLEGIGEKLKASAERYLA
mmetsp:Transcript_4189/g.5803  ORF Transcript_4189/g.5803 Transcript_4189/m.5803 type:complete len:636 (+) Transcript_4189:54-1961(+)